VTWDDAVEFCSRLSQQEDKAYRLPTEAQWEYACRAGTTTHFSFGDNDSALGDYAWYRNNTYDMDQRYPHPVGQKRPNPWGLHDMHGNVYEWCSDFYDEDYYSNSPSVDPAGPPLGEARSVRGGSWLVRAHALRCSVRVGLVPGVRYVYVGFRVVRSQP
jgi:formylglycine-generating enzyme required for sulfatase activity